MTNNLISTSNLTFLDILKYPPMEISAQKITFIKGPSGTGKTTLLKLFNSTLSPETGEIQYMGKNIIDIDPIELRRNLLLCGQTLYLFDDTIRNNFHTFYAYRNVTPPKDDVIQRFLDICVAPFSLDMRCERLSGGERQRVYIAIFLSFQSEVLMLDEPTSALDSETSTQLFENLREYVKNHNISLIVVSHDEKIVEQFAEEIIVISNENKTTSLTMENTGLRKQMHKVGGRL